MLGFLLNLIEVTRRYLPLLVLFVLFGFFIGYAAADTLPGPASPASAPAPARQAEPLPQSGCIVMAGRCSCVINGSLRPSDVCPSAGGSRDLSGVFPRAVKPAQYLPFPDFRPAPLPPAEPARLGRFWVY